MWIEIINYLKSMLCIFMGWTVDGKQTIIHFKAGEMKTLFKIFLAAYDAVRLKKKKKNTHFFHAAVILIYWANYCESF